ncbi:MAG: helix-turn-helix domain-containing protein [Gammaproteobacteria bacterium]
MAVSDGPFGEQLRQHRERAGMTKAEAARVAGVSAARWGQVEAGRERKGGYEIPTRPGREWVIKAARAVGWSEGAALAAASHPSAAASSDPPVSPWRAELDRLWSRTSSAQQQAIVRLLATMVSPAATPLDVFGAPDPTGDYRERVVDRPPQPIPGETGGEDVSRS